MTAIKFVKMQGVGNDFVVVSSESISGLNPASVALATCERKFGIGADGLLIIGPPPSSAAFTFRMHNPDGSPDMCGNGLRCAVLYAHRAGLIPKAYESVTVETIDGLLQGTLLSVSPGGNIANVRVQMAVPSLNPASIPFVGPVTQPQLIDYPITIDDYELKITAVNTGSTHSIVFVEELPDDALFFVTSPKIELHPYFPERTSLMWAKQVGDAHFKIRIWERAAGETLGCGTGASAVAVAAISKGLAKHSDHVQIESDGGTLSIDWPETTDSPLWLTGPAVWVYEGLFYDLPSTL